MMDREKTFGERLIEGMEEAVSVREGRASARVRRREASVIGAQRPPCYSGSDIQTIRVSLGVSQHAFARVLNVTAATVRAWERGSRRPSGTAMRLLEIASKNPDAIAVAR